MELKRNSHNDLLDSNERPASAKANARKSFADLRNLAKQQQHDETTKIFMGRMIAKKKAWTDPDKEETADPLRKRRSSNGSCRKSLSPKPISRKPSGSKVSGLALDDVDRIHQWVTDMKGQGQTGEKMLQEFIMKQAGVATAQTVVASASVPMEIHISH